MTGLDLSSSSVEVLGWAADEARRSGRDVMADHVWDPGGDIAAGPPSSLSVALRRADLAAMLNRVVASSAVPDVHVDQAVLTGNPKHLLVHLSENAEMLVLGEGGEGRASCHVVRRHCLRHARCPVVTVPADWRPNGLPVRSSPDEHR